MTTKAENADKAAKMKDAAIDLIQHGVLKLTTPLLSAGVEIAELKYDYNALTGDEYLKAMDADVKGDVFGISTKQALYLFAYAAKGNGGLDTTDIVQRMGVADMMAAARSGMLFFRYTASRADGNTKSWSATAE